MQFKITWQYIIAFVALNLVMGELHEQAHITTGYIICGCYGPRDFSVWSTCGSCARGSWVFLATLAGPLFSYSLMWLGASWFSSNSNHSKRSLGFALLFANLPFARIFTAIIGGGDEKVVIHYLLGENSPIIYAKILAAILAILICLPPVLMVARRMANTNRLVIIAGFLTIPLVYGMLYQRIFLNKLLSAGTGNNITIMGTPDLVLFHFALMLLLLFFFQKSLGQSFLYVRPVK